MSALTAISEPKSTVTKAAANLLHSKQVEGRNAVKSFSPPPFGIMGQRLTQVKHLQEHELTYVVQQSNGSVFRKMVQRQHETDFSGWRYTPEFPVMRSIREIQAIVGTNPNGVYDINTKNAVEKYQNKLKAVGLYNYSITGLWEENTETAHLEFSTFPNIKTKDYNCAGFAFKSYNHIELEDTKRILSTMTKLPDCAKPCNPYFHKFWFWEFNFQVKNTRTGIHGQDLPDFHIVGGQTDRKGKSPAVVMSKNGKRPLQGPAPPLSWEPATGQFLHPETGNPEPNTIGTVSKLKLSCFCSEFLLS